MYRPGFTLVELVVVVLILGILASVAAGRFLSVSDDAVAVTITQQLDTVANQIEMQTAIQGGRFPPVLLPQWFRANKLPHHPQNSYKVSELETVSDKSATHPANKILSKNSEGAYWYNAALGIVRARVTWQGSSGATVALYNLVNRSNETFTAVKGSDSIVASPL